MKDYELTVLFHPDLEMNLDPAIDKVKKLIESNGGKIIKEENDGKKRLAYSINNQEFAIYYFADVELPELKARMRELRRVHMENWFDLYKPLGWDIMDMRYGSLFTRIDSAVEEINMYLDGKLDRIEELEQERLYYNGVEGSIKYMNYFGDVVSPSRIAPKA